MFSSPTSFIVQPYRRSQLRSYFQRYGQDSLQPLWDDNCADVLEEQGFEIPDSPRSIYRVEKLFEALAKFEPSKSPAVNVRDQHVQAGLRFAHACMDKPKGAPYLPLPTFTIAFVSDITTNKNASAGLTYYGQTKEYALIRAYDRACQIILGEKRPEPCIAYKRTQFNDKTRLVWGYPYSMTALEGIFARPVIDAFRRDPGVMAFTIPDLVLGGELRRSSYHRKFCYVTDVSSFDSSAPACLIHQAFESVRTWFDLDQIEPTTGVCYRRILDIVEQYFIHTPIVMPDGNVYKGKKHGVPSGSYFTQWVDTFINVTQAGTASSKFHLKLDAQYLKALGDDMEFWSDVYIPYPKLAAYLSRTFHCTLKPEKGGLYHYTQPIKFLGRIWTNGLPDQEEGEILARMAQPESYRKYPSSKRKRAYAAQQLILSYVTQYYSAGRIYASCYMATNNRYTRMYSDYVRACHMGLNDGQNGDDLTLNPDHLSGLQRYKLKYLSTGGQSAPVALQYWL